jgi:membrane-associated HD superfamily phosphohydrolase
MKHLSKLNNDELENSLGVYVRNERLTLDSIYEHINEVFRRDLHLERGFSTMKDYLVKKWNYSERDAYRKIDGAKLLKDVPALAIEIKNGTINADKIGELSRAVREKEQATGVKVSALKKTELVALISGKTVSESQKELAKALDIQVKEHEVKRFQQDDSVRIELSIPRELYDQIMRCREHASHKIYQANLPQTMESAFKILSDFYIAENKLMDESSPIAEKSTEKINKTLTQKTRRDVIVRDKCCQYKDPKTGQMCGSKYFEQVDHRTSQWAGGNHVKTNLQVLCANHNQFKYRKESQLRWL